MTEMIRRQKIAKRHTHGSGAVEKRSLIASADKFRLSASDKHRNKNHFSTFRNGLSGGLKNKITRRPGKRKINVQAGPSGQKVERKKSFAAGLKKKVSSFKLHFNFLNSRILIVVCAVLVAGGLIAYFVNGWVSEMTMFEELSLHKDVISIDDVLYESLPSDFNGQGSGEIAGIEPVLLTSGDPLTYKVRPGDTLSEIAKKNNIKIGTLISFNKVSDVRRLQVGMELKIPEYDGVPYEVKSGDSISGISKKYNISVNSILDANNLDTDILQAGDILFIPGAAMNEFDYKKAMGTLFIYPTNGRLSSGFGYRPDPFTGKSRFHNGIDLANATGTRISATMSGVVADIGERPTGYGKYVIVKHSNGYQSLYGHMSRIVVRKGQYISQGEKIGEMGTTGRSTGPHLHFSIYKNNSPVNPLTYLW